MHRITLKCNIPFTRSEIDILKAEAVGFAVTFGGAHRSRSIESLIMVAQNPDSSLLIGLSPL